MGTEKICSCILTQIMQTNKIHMNIEIMQFYLDNIFYQTYWVNEFINKQMEMIKNCRETKVMFTVPLHLLCFSLRSNKISFLIKHMQSHFFPIF